MAAGAPGACRCTWRTAPERGVHSCHGKPAPGSNHLLHPVSLVAAGWLDGAELLATFDTELGEVAQIPGSGGVFEVRVDGELVWSRTVQSRFPEAKELKQLVRDQVAPDKDLGHSDR